MDYNLMIIVSVIVVITFIAVYLVSVVAIREKTFEEAIAEQKKRSDELLGASSNTQKKEKKTKEKKKRKRLNIETEPEIIDQHHDSRRPSVIEKEIKSILVNKEEQSPIVNETVEANEFEIIHPKDDYELKRSFDEEKNEENDKDLLDGQSNECSNEQEILSQQSSANEQIVQQQEENLQTTENKVAENKTGPLKAEKKKKKEQLTFDKVEANLTKIQLSSDEIQNLIDILLNKEHSEWVNKGKPDTLSTLKKQLAEKEEQMAEEARTVVSLQQKLKELRTDMSNEKGKYSQIKRSFEEQAIKINEFANIQVKFQQLNEKNNNEKAVLQREHQQLTNLVKQLQAENINFKNALDNCRNAESIEREADALRTQLGHLENQLTAAFNSNQELTNKTRSYQDTLFAEKKRVEELINHNSSFKERESQLINELKKRDEAFVNLEQVKTDLTKEILLLKERVKIGDENRSGVEKQVEEYKREKEEFGKKLEEKFREADDLKKQISAKENEVALMSSMKSEVDKLTQQIDELNNNKKTDDAKITKLEELNKNLLKEQQIIQEKVTKNVSDALNLTELKTENKKLTDQINNLTDLNRSDKTKIDELDSLNKQLLEEKKSYQEKVLKIDENQDNLTTELKSEKDRLEEQVRQMTESHRSDELRIEQMEALNKQLLDDKRSLSAHVLQNDSEIKLMTELKSDKAALECKLNDLKSSENDKINQIEKLTQQLNQQQLNQDKKPTIQPDNEKTNNLREIFQNKFPTIELSDESSWPDDFSKKIHSKLEELIHYQSVLANTELLLSNLQSSIEKEEQKWHLKINEKDRQIEMLKAEAAASNNVTSTKLNNVSQDNNNLLDKSQIGNGIVAETENESYTSATNNSASSSQIQKSKKKKGTKK